MSAAAVLITLSIDEAEVIYSTEIEDYVPMPEGGAENFEKLLSLSQIKLELLDMDRPHSDEWEALLADEAAYKSFILSKKEVILSNYAALESVLPLVRELSQAGPIGDTYVDLESDFVRFGTIRDCWQTIVFYSELTYYDDSLDADAEDLHSMIQMKQNWIGHTRILVNSMIAIAGVREGYDAVRRLVPHLSEAEVERWHEQFSPPFDAVTTVSNGLFGEYCSISPTIDMLEREGGGRLPFLYHKNRTLNRYGQFVNDVVQLARERDWISLSTYYEDSETSLEPSYFRRNYFGQLLLFMAIPAFQKTYEVADQLNHEQAELILLLEERLSE